MPRSDLRGDELLQMPEIAVVDAVLGELRDGLVEIFGAAPVHAARFGKDLRRLLVRPRAAIAGPAAVQHEGDRPDRLAFRLDRQPARRLRDRHARPAA